VKTVNGTVARRVDVERAILEAARDLLAARGLQGLSMRALAERVGITAAALYHYFDSKDALVERVVQQGFRRFGEYLRSAAGAHPVGSLERVRAIGEAYLRFALENQAYFRVLFSLQHEQEMSLEDLPEAGGYGMLRRAVVDAIESGAMREADPDLMVMYLWSIAHGLLTISLACRVDRCPEFDVERAPLSPVETFRAFAPLVWDGIARVGGGPVASDGEPERKGT
jgi:AcrR family transcriptional regulator